MESGHASQPAHFLKTTHFPEIASKQPPKIAKDRGWGEKKVLRNGRCREILLASGSDRQSGA